MKTINGRPYKKWIILLVISILMASFLWVFIGSAKQESYKVYCQNGHLYAGDKQLISDVLDYALISLEDNVQHIMVLHGERSEVVDLDGYEKAINEGHEVGGYIRIYKFSQSFGHLKVEQIYENDFTKVNPWCIDAGNMDGDLTPDIFVGVYRATEFYEADRRPFLFQWENEQLVRVWTGSSLNLRTFYEAGFEDYDDDGLDELYAVQPDESGLSKFYYVKGPFTYYQKAVVKITSTEEEIVEIEESVTEVHLTFAGDIMFHQDQLDRAYDEESGDYNFDGILQGIKPNILEADFACANLETVFGGSTLAGYTGYPYFNTPDSVLEIIESTGFDCLITANNHALDRGLEGLKRTYQLINDHQMLPVGTALDSKGETQFFEIEGISFAITAYTYDVNGGFNDTQINSLNAYDVLSMEALYEDVKEAEDKLVDFNMVYLHFGNEYKSTVDQVKQRDLAYNLMALGADLVIGSHPHVLQPLEIVRDIEGEALQTPKMVVYSLGNLISAQKETYNAEGPTDVGMLFDLYISKNKEGVSISGFGFTPTMTLWREDGLYTIPIDNINKVLIEDYKISQEELESIQESRQWVEGVLLGELNPDTYIRCDDFEYVYTLKD